MQSCSQLLTFQEELAGFQCQGGIRVTLCELERWRKVVRVRHFKACRGSRVLAPLIHNLGVRWRRVVNLTPRLLYTLRYPRPVGAFRRENSFALAGIRTLWTVRVIAYCLCSPDWHTISYIADCINLCIAQYEPYFFWILHSVVFLFSKTGEIFPAVLLKLVVVFGRIPY
jgi:hypothetical protein